MLPTRHRREGRLGLAGDGPRRAVHERGDHRRRVGHGAWPQIDCSTCHKSPGASWSDGIFHANIGAATPKDCVSCHYLVMADAAKADLTSGTNYAMKHRSAQLTFQTCQTCHTGALAKATSHADRGDAVADRARCTASVATQPTACVDCHSVSRAGGRRPDAERDRTRSPPGGTGGNGAQWMNHGSSYVAGKDCVVCHAADAKTSGSAWSKSDSFHTVVADTVDLPGLPRPHQRRRHGAGDQNNLPVGADQLDDGDQRGDDAVDRASPAGTLDQIIHADVNVTGHDCNFCHTQVGRLDRRPASPARSGRRPASTRTSPPPTRS